MDPKTAEISQVITEAIMNNDFHMLMHLALAALAGALLAVPGQAIIEHTLGSWKWAPKWLKAFSPLLLSATGAAIMRKYGISQEQATAAFASATALMHIINESNMAADANAFTLAVKVKPEITQ